jgi:hypothetical protein
LSLTVSPTDPPVSTEPTPAPSDQVGQGYWYHVDIFCLTIDWRFDVLLQSQQQHSL